MRKFFSYGPVNKNSHYYVPRKELIEYTYQQLVGESLDEGGHYIAVWASRQRGKTWIIAETLQKLQREHKAEFDTVLLSLQHLMMTTDDQEAMQAVAEALISKLALNNVTVRTFKQFEHLFSREVLTKPLILILDEFDSLPEEAISGIAGVFRNIYNQRRIQMDKPGPEKDYLLHSVALVGVRSVLGIENQRGSPFNVQRSVHIPNLTFEEVESMFRWYERESGQMVEQAVIDRVFYETQGQPGLTSWLGELLTETYNEDQTAPLTMTTFNRVYLWATYGLGNNNVLNIISKAKQQPYQAVVLNLFKTDKKTPFRYDNPNLNFLYLNGVIAIEETPTELYIKFPCPFIQKRLFNYFANVMFEITGQLYDPFEDLSDTITETSLNIRNLLKRYEHYLKKNRGWLLKDAPRRADLRLYEAVYHFNVYRYLASFLESYSGQVWPEFPTGNGEIDLVIKHAGKVYGLEVKSFTNRVEYHKALGQAARYGRRLQLAEITLALFVEAVDDANRARYETIYEDEETGVTVEPVFVVTGN